MTTYNIFIFKQFFFFQFECAMSYGVGFIIFLLDLKSKPNIYFCKWYYILILCMKVIPMRGNIILGKKAVLKYVQLSSLKSWLH